MWRNVFVSFLFICPIAEFDEIGKEYPNEICADRETAEVFRNKYVDGHSMLLEGWDRLI